MNAYMTYFLPKFRRRKQTPGLAEKQSADSTPSCPATRRILLDTLSRDKLEEKELFLFYVLNLHKHRDTLETRNTQDADGTIYTIVQDIAATFVQHLAYKFRLIQVIPQAITDILKHIQPVDLHSYENL
jgi:hypothetical protein